MIKTSTRVDVRILKTDIKTGKTVESVVSARTVGMVFLKLELAQSSGTYEISFVDEGDEQLFIENRRQQVGKINRIYIY